MGDEADFEDAYAEWADSVLKRMAAAGCPTAAIELAEECLTASADGSTSDGLDPATLAAADEDPDLLVAAARAMTLNSGQRGTFAMYAEAVHQYGEEAATEYGAFLLTLTDRSGTPLGIPGAVAVRETLRELGRLLSGVGMTLLRHPAYADVIRPAPDGEGFANVAQLSYRNLARLRADGATAVGLAAALLATGFNLRASAAIAVGGVAAPVADGWL